MIAGQIVAYNDRLAEVVHADPDLTSPSARFTLRWLHNQALASYEARLYARSFKVTKTKAEDLK